MTSKVRHLSALHIDGDLDNLQLVLLSNADHELIRYRLTREMVCKLAIEIPRYASRLADGGAVDKLESFKD